MIFGGYGSSALVGNYAIAQRLTNFPVTLFAGGIRPVLFQKATRADDISTLSSLVCSLLLGLSLLTIPMVVVFNTTLRSSSDY